MSYTFKETPGRVAGEQVGDLRAESNAKEMPGAPLFFVFHGTGGDETQFLDVARQLKPDAHVIAPRGDVSEQGMLRFFRRKAEGVYDMEDLAARTQTMAKFVAERVAGLKPSRVIGLGYSNGANILASVMMTKPDLFHDAVLMHPLIPWKPPPVAGLEDRRVLITAGERDLICPAPLTQRLKTWFAEQGADVEAVWHGGGHEVRPQEWAAVQKFLR